jgi:prolipoprotein diacylglyceryltransferase
VRPILFRVGDIEIWSHAVFVALGTAIALVAAWRVAIRHRMAQRELVWIISGGLVGAALLARFGLVVRYLYLASDPTPSGFLEYGGRTLVGGLAGAYAGVVVTRRLIGFRRRTGDVLAPGVALGIGLGRIGCLLAERPGTVTTLPWGVHAAPNLPGCQPCQTGLAMHPSFLYESVFLVLAAWVLFALVRRPQPVRPWLVEGDLFKLFLLAYAAFRFGVEFVRGNPAIMFGLSGSQLVVLPAAIVLAAYFGHSRHARIARAAAPAPA